MGCGESKILSAYMLEYDFIKLTADRRFGEVGLVQSKKDKTRYYLKSRLFNAKTERKEPNFYDNRKNIASPYLLKMKDAKYDEMEENILEDDRVHILFEIPQGDLDQDITKRVPQKNYYQERDLTGIIHDVSQGCAVLQERNIAHGIIEPSHILTTQQGNYQVSDQLFINYGTTAPVRALLDKKENASPEELRGEVNYNPYKSDVFSLGVTILAAAQLRNNLNDIYQGNNVNFQQIENHLANLSNGGFSQEFIIVLQAMLRADNASRPDWRWLKGYFEGKNPVSDLQGEPLRQNPQPAQPAQPVQSGQPLNTRPQALKFSGAPNTQPQPQPQTQSPPQPQGPVPEGVVDWSRVPSFDPYGRPAYPLVAPYPLAQSVPVPISYYPGAPIQYSPVQPLTASVQPQRILPAQVGSPLRASYIAPPPAPTSYVPATYPAYPASSPYTSPYPSIRYQERMTHTKDVRDDVPFQLSVITNTYSVSTPQKCITNPDNKVHQHSHTSAYI
eukprot:TRINITY_DN6305_c0_g1_i5.p1 TRINITY_DN6305_c0_g1~~TRINITY_DN6305_c0_g1_i5.p1  ORF type:complete len:502 (-),score=183.04 TRINITY_DN6305_c0_g1_i5:229-1734(-)